MSNELVRILPYSVDLDKTIEKTELHDLFVMGDSLAHRIELEITRGGAPVSLSGCTVNGYFTSFAEDTTIMVDGEVKNGKAAVTLSKPCYTLHGQFVLTIQITGGGVDASVFCGEGFMRQTKTETIIYDDYVIYDVSTLLTQIGSMKAATQAANTATSNANTSTANANTATGKANTAASAANTAATNANTAKDAANAAAGKIDNMTVSATPVSTGTATAELSTVDGHYHLALGLPKGNTGATPQISVQVQTGAAGSEAQVSVSGTAENPVIHLTIPRGDAGDIGNLTINGKSPDGGGAVTLEMSDIDGLPDAIAGAGGVKTVAGVGPDRAGNVTLTASDVGALAVSGTAADSRKLGGKAPEYYLQPRNLLDNSDFRNPVNQRRKSEYSNAAYTYTIDRWKTLDSGSVTVADGYIVTTNHLVQFMPKNLNGIYTAAAKMLDGTLLIASGAIDTLSIGDGNTIQAGNDGEVSYFALRKAGSFLWAALYEGSYTADTLPPYVPKGYGTELNECRRYFQPNIKMVAIGLNSNWIQVNAFLSPIMRTGPSVTIHSLKNDTISYDLTNAYLQTNNIVVSQGYFPNATLAAGTPYVLNFDSSADL